MSNKEEYIQRAQNNIEKEYSISKLTLSRYREIEIYVIKVLTELYDLAFDAGTKNIKEDKNEKEK